MTLQEIINEIKKNGKVSFLEWQNRDYKKKDSFLKSEEDLINLTGIMVEARRIRCIEVVYSSKSYLIYIYPEIFMSGREEVAIMNEMGSREDIFLKMAKKYGTRFISSDDVLGIQIDTIKKGGILRKEKIITKEYLWPKIDGLYLREENKFYGPFKATEEKFYNVYPEDIQKLRLISPTL